MPRRVRGRGRRRRPSYDWVYQEESYDTCLEPFFLTSGNCDEPQVEWVRLTAANLVSIDQDFVQGTPAITRSAQRVKGQVHFFPGVPNESFFTSTQFGWLHFRIIKAQMRLDGSPASRTAQTSGGAISLGSSLSADEDFIWETKIPYLFRTRGAFDNWWDPDIGWGGYTTPMLQPRTIEVDTSSSRRLAEDEALFFLMEWQASEVANPLSLPQMWVNFNLRTLMRLPRM